MEQLELDLGLQPIQKWLHVWTEAERKKALDRSALEKPRVEKTEHQAASFSTNSGQI